jgi:hypothetical protein
MTGSASAYRKAMALLDGTFIEELLPYSSAQGVPWLSVALYLCSMAGLGLCISSQHVCCFDLG